MSRVRKPLRGNSVVANAIAQNEKLSLQARGLYLLLMSYPHDWEFNLSHLHKAASCGKDAFNTARKQLEALGYLRSSPSHNERGHVDGLDLELAEKPFEFEHESLNAENPQPGQSLNAEKPHAENPHSLTSNNYNHTPLTPQGGPEDEKRIERHTRLEYEIAIEKYAENADVLGYIPLDKGQIQKWWDAGVTVTTIQTFTDKQRGLNPRSWAPIALMVNAEARKKAEASK